MGLVDGLASLQINATTFSGTNVQASTVSGTAVQGSTVADAFGNLLNNFVGSPNDGSVQTTVSANRVQTGFSRLGSGTAGWVTFGSPFNGVMNSIFATPAFCATGFFPPIYSAAGSASAGSVWLQVSGTQAGSIFYLAIGP